MELDYEAVIQGNIKVHAKEARYYDYIHQEIFNKKEQSRLQRSLTAAVNQIGDCGFKALDFGAGTGNVTEKLLRLGFNVTAIDISPEMCSLLAYRNRSAMADGKLTVCNLNLDKAFLTEKFDLVTCYSVLHHLPDYIFTLRKLTQLVKKGGVLYIDHEDTDTWRKQIYIEKTMLKMYFFVNTLLFKAYLQLHKIKLPKINYEKSDVTHINWQEIIQVLRQADFSLTLEAYHTAETKFETPLNLLHKIIVGPNMMFLTAKKN